MQAIMEKMDQEYDKNEGTGITFTFNEGLIVQILPNGNV